MQDKCTKLHLLKQVHVLQGFVPATSREKERKRGWQMSAPLPHSEQKPESVSEWNGKVGKNLVVLT